ncbi:MAG: helix-turn-helix transcriptional regulator [Verrucomicrobiota bacterium]
MIRNSHLVLHEEGVPAGTEWSTNLQGWLFLRILRGEGCVFRGKTPLLVSEGDALVYAPGRSCQLRASQLGELRIQYFYVFPELLTGTISATERQHLEEAAQLERTFPLHRAASSPFAQQFAVFSQQASTSHALLVRCEMLRLSALILAVHLPPPAPQVSHVLNAKDRFEMLVAEMVESELHNRPPEELARQCGCGVRHFSRLFRSYFGRSFVPKRIELCLHKARQMLEESDAKIIDVALASGFNHVGLFSSRFKKRYGATPSEWRKRKRQSAVAKRNGQTTTARRPLITA